MKIELKKYPTTVEKILFEEIGTISYEEKIIEFGFKQMRCYLTIKSEKVNQIVYDNNDEYDNCYYYNGLKIFSNSAHGFGLYISNLSSALQKDNIFSENDASAFRLKLFQYKKELRSYNFLADL